MAVQRKQKRRVKNFPSPYTVTDALKKGDLYTRLGMILMGVGNLARKQVVKGILFLLVEAGYLYFMITSGINNIYHLVTLGGETQREVWNEAKGIYEYTTGDNSLLFLLYGVATVFVTIGFIVLWRTAVKSGYKAQCLASEGKHIQSFREDLRSLKDDNLHNSLLTLPIMGILGFTILPLIFMICMAFTNYSKQEDHLVLFN